MKAALARTNPVAVHQVRDGWARIVGIPAFGLFIPHLTGLFGPIEPRDPLFWIGTVWFVALAGAIWQGNRRLLFVQRRHLDWFDRPFYKIIALVFACTFYTLPVTVAALALWFMVAGLPIDIEAVTVVGLTNVICVLFVTHAYETAFLIKGRAEDYVRLADLRTAVTAAQLDALRRQVDPHFLFNSLNTLGALLESDPRAAARFNTALAEIYRYLLDDRDLVTLDEELEFVRAYGTLMQVRFGEALQVEVPPGTGRGAKLPPTAVQCLVENAVKHTRFDKTRPLHIKVVLAPDGVRVENPKRHKHLTRPSSGLGLENLDERCRLLVGRPIEVVDKDGHFTVTVPVRP